MNLEIPQKQVCVIRVIREWAEFQQEESIEEIVRTLQQVRPFAREVRWWTSHSRHAKHRNPYEAQPKGSGSERYERLKESFTTVEKALARMPINYVCHGSRARKIERIRRIEAFRLWLRGEALKMDYQGFCDLPEAWYRALVNELGKRQ